MYSIEAWPFSTPTVVSLHVAWSDSKRHVLVVRRLNASAAPERIAGRSRNESAVIRFGADSDKQFLLHRIVQQFHVWEQEPQQRLHKYVKRALRTSGSGSESR